ncbi:MAG: hypothetical protein WD904_00365 [Dehalococcoidia bacterium]
MDKLTQQPLDNELNIEVIGGNTCVYFDGIEVSESDESVAIAAYTRSYGTGCDDSLWEFDAVETLGTPLGDRALFGRDPQAGAFGNPLGPGDCANHAGD